MCFSRSLKGEHDGIHQTEDNLNARPVSTTATAPKRGSASMTYQPPAGPPPNYSHLGSNNPFSPPPGPPPSQTQYEPPSGPPPSQGGYAPPPGPPPSHGYEPPSGPPPSHILYDAPSGPPPTHNDYAPPPGPPPARSYEAPSGPPPTHNDYAPPPGPPPARSYEAPSGPPPSHNGYAPPPGPPPSQKVQEPYQEPYHDWQAAVPDTSLLPPPPSLGEDRSATNNATLSEADRGGYWCKARPLLDPKLLPSSTISAVETGVVELMRPAQYVGSVQRLRQGTWSCASKRSSPDSCLMSTEPLYSALAHSPTTLRRSKTIYFEIAISPRNRSEVSVGLGFVAQPYPPFRLPGWERASLGVHGDDGNKYINDCWGGKGFTTPFKPGEVIGIGMIFSPKRSDAPPAYGQPQPSDLIDVEIFLTKGGQKVGGWDLHEEADASQDRPVTGLEGGHDLFAAVGTFEEAAFEVRFESKDWLYVP